MSRQLSSQFKISKYLGLHINIHIKQYDATNKDYKVLFNFFRNASGYDTSKSLPRGKASFASQRYGSSFVEFTGKVLRTA